MLFPCGPPTLGQASRGPPDAPRQMDCLTLADFHKTAVAVQHLLASGNATCADFTLTNLLCCGCIKANSPHSSDINILLLAEWEGLVH